MTTDKRMKLTHLIKKLTDESVEQLLETACKLFAANTIAQRPDCPYCQSSSISLWVFSHDLLVSSTI